MNVRDSEFDALLGEWLEDDPFVAPAAPVDVAIDFARSHPRRRDWLAFMRRDGMTGRPATGLRPVAIMVVVTAVLVLGVGGAVLVGSRLDATPSPMPSADASTTPTPDAEIPYVISGPVSGPGSTPVEPGTYRMRGPGESPDGWPGTVIVTIPDDWDAVSAVRGAGLVWQPESGDVATLNFSSVGNLFADPCAFDVRRGPLLDPPVGSSVDDLVAALLSLPGLQVSEPAATTLDGWDGVQLEVTAPAACGTAALWVTPPLDGENWDVYAYEGWRMTLRILDIDGLRFVVISAYAPDAPADVQLDLQRMVDSIDIEP